ncbi:MAG: O-antigen ligase family protein [Halieaceae bacterium]|jgi:O-antigen ligase|nr:O-antigen ligase family protein [Halieaceae bacterium]
MISRLTLLLPILLPLAVILLPFGKLVEVPLGLLFLAGIVLLWRLPKSEDVPWSTLAGLWAAFTLPMLLALPDAVALEKSLLTTVGTLRFGLSCAAMLALFSLAAAPAEFQRRTLHGFGLVVALCLLLWCADALLQFVTGRNILGYGLGEGYVNGLFGDDDNIKLGATVALLLPVALVHGLRHWPLLPTLAMLLLILAVIVLSGKRAAWVMAAVELALVALYYMVRGRLGLLRAMLFGLAALAVAALAFSYSDWVRERSTIIVEAVESPDYDTLNRATGIRLPIWGTALRIGRDHWVNGVGPRGFRYVYTDYASADDVWARPLPNAPGAKASHAHQLILELWCETGVIGIGGYLAMLFLLLRSWQRADEAARSRALPFAATLGAMLFPVNTHPAWYSSWSSLLLWMFIGLYLFALCAEKTKVAHTKQRSAGSADTVLGSTAGHVSAAGAAPLR